ncbi:MAG: apolipoprotein N-acyltransferase [Psychromonas sp.]|jgi:apolipoprotein N-acyltransferase
MLALNKSHRIYLSLLSGILMGVSFPYTGSLFPLMAIAFVPLFIVEKSIADRNYKSRKVFFHAYLGFLVYNLITTWWIWYASEGGMIMAVLANSIIMALVFYAFHLIKKYIGAKEGYLGFIILWVAFEYCHLHWEVSWPWLHLGNTFARVPEIIQWYSFSGILGGTLWILIINSIVFWLINNVYFRKESWKVQTPIFYLLLVTVVIPVSISLLQYSTYNESTEEVLKVQVLQPNIDPYGEKFFLPMNQQVNQILELSESTIKESTDLILSPETSLAYEFYESDLTSFSFYPALASHANKHNSVMLIGASTRAFYKSKHSIASRKLIDGPGYYESYNSSLLLTPDENPKFVHKSKLVLGVEKIPFIKYLPFLENLSIDLDGTSGTLGIETEPQVLKVKNSIIAPVICYESIYGEFIARQCNKGAKMIAIITNDGWWRDTPGYRQHMAFARLRAVENRRSLARSANTGTSGFINQRGDIIESSIWWNKTAMTQTLNLNSELTFYSKHGDFIGRSFTFVSSLLLLFLFVKRFKKKFVQ